MRKISTYEKKRWGQRSKAEKWGVAKRKRTEDKELLILGTGRSGSRFFSRLFQKIGYDVGHEKVNDYGTSTHYFYVDHYWYPMHPWSPDNGAHVGERLSDFNFKRVIHVVREPLACIASIRAIFGSLEWEFAEDTDILPTSKISKLERCMWYYLNVNGRIEHEFNTIRVNLEEVEQQFPTLMRKLKMKHDYPDIKPMNKSHGYRKAQPLTWVELSQEHAALAKKIRKLGKRYGY